MNCLFRCVANISPFVPLRLHRQVERSAGPDQRSGGAPLGKWLWLSLLIAVWIANWGVADMPYPAPPPGIDPYDYHLYLFLAPTSPLPNDFSGGGNDWKLTSERTTSWVRFSKQELWGIMGASVDKAWQVSTGRPDVLMAVLDSGIKWQDNQPDLFNKLYLNRGELPIPEGSPTYDANADGVFNTRDYANDSRVSDVNGNGVDDPEDLILIFSDGIDDDSNGYIDDISGWDFFEGDNNPRDDVRYGHGTGEAIWSSGEGNNGGQLGPALNNLVLPVRVGDSFIVDTNEFAQGVVFAVDSGATVVQEALGALNHTRFAQEAVAYADRHGVTMVGAAGDEQSARHNFPANDPHIIMANSVTKFAEFGGLHQSPPSYLYLNGCTNFGGRIDISVPSASCSSEATGKLAGMVGLVYATAKNEIAKGELQPYPGTHWPLSPNEVRQIVTMSADDINFETPRENYQTWLPVPSERFHSRPGWDAYFGYGRTNARRMLEMVAEGQIPPEAELTTPGWFDIIDPDDGTLEIVGRVAALRADAFRYIVEVAPSVNPGGDYETVYESGILSGVYEGKLADLDLSWLSILMPHGVEGPLSGDDGRGDPERFSFTVRVQVTDNHGRHGEARRSLFLHRDPDLMDGFPQKIAGDGVSSPVFVDVNGDGIQELIYATSNGGIHALQPFGQELPGWPVMTDPIPLVDGAAGYHSGEISTPVFSPVMMGSPAIGDLEGDGNLEVVAADMEGRVYVWEHDGSRRAGFPVSTNRAYSTVFRPNGEYRRDKDNRVDWGIAAQPALGDLNDDGALEIVVGSMDMHVYAWQADGAPLPGWPVYLRSPEKVESVEPGTHFTVLKSDAGARIGSKIIAAPSIGDITGDGVPEVIIGTNEEYHEFPNIILRPKTIELLKQVFVDGRKADSTHGTSIEKITPPTNKTAQLIDFSVLDDLPIGNGRLYAIWADGTLHDGDSGDDDGLDADAFVDGWPVRVGQLILEVLPTIGTGVNMPAVLADVDGDSALEVGASSVLGPYYVFKGNGVSIYGRDLLGRDIALPGDLESFGENANSVDAPNFAAVGGGIFADLGDGVSVIAPTGGLTKALDLFAPAEQLNSDAQMSAWRVVSRTFHPGFPHEMNDLQFVTTASVADIDGDGLPEILAGSGVYDVHAVDRNGDETPNWPKLAGDAVATTPAVGDFNGDGTLEVAAFSRNGWLFVWRTGAPASGLKPWPKYQHDFHNSGNLDLILP
ncbi:hypothetical protein HYR99_18540 [Candidatus Poribacteria bacterium]|nr:hypothetical protein [Candidatus Poribacteria bacterium]